MNAADLPEKLGWAWKALFWPPSLLYSAAVRARARAYRRGFMETVRLPLPVYCLGNLTVGGAGKTPGVIWLAEYLIKKGRRPAVVTRGYGVKNGEAVRVVSDGQGTVLPSHEAGDEPWLLARRLPTVPVLAGADRAVAGRRALEEFGADCLVMDDGFQHIRLFRNLNLLCLDALEAPAFFHPGGACLLPAGRLREPLSALWRADVVFLTKADLLTREALEALRRKVEECLLDVPVVPVYYALTFYDHVTGEPWDAVRLRDRPALAMSGLARPAAFEASLRRHGMQVSPLRFRDHHFFTAEERRAALKRSQAEGSVVIVTEKDAARLPPDFPCLVARLDWSPQDSLVPEKGDVSARPRTVPWTQRLDSAIS